jgi:hypothetical protein
MTEQNGHKPYLVKISGPRVNVETMTDEPTARALMEVIMGGLTEPPTLVPPEGQQQRTTSLREFVDSSGAKSIAAQVLAIAEFVRTTERKDEFTRDEIGDHFRLADLAPPTNLARDFQTAADYGWIAEDPRALGHYFITTKGHEVLRQRFERA